MRAVVDREDELVLSATEAKEGCTKRVRIGRRAACRTCRDAPFRGCVECRDGLVDAEEEIDVVVRAGTPHGARVSVLGKGDARIGAPAGDRYFVVLVDGAPDDGAHPYRAPGQPRPQGSPLAVRQPGSKTAVPMVFAGMIFIVATILIGLFVGGR